MIDNLRIILKPTLEKMGRGFASTGLSPNFWTATGLVLVILAAITYGLGVQHSLLIGGVLLLGSGFLDVVDGQVARVTGRTSARGAYLDSMFDKIGEVAVFVGIMIGGYADPLLVMLAITLSLLVSYARAKSDALGVHLAGVGIGERGERLLVVAIVCIAGYVEYAMMIVIAITAITVIQRIIVTVKKI